MAEEQSRFALLRAWARFEETVWPRMGVWLWITLVLVLGIAYLATHFLKILLWKLTLLTLAAFVGDKIARGMERGNARPHELLKMASDIRVNGGSHDIPEQLEARADGIYLRRAIIIAATMIAAALGT